MEDEEMDPHPDSDDTFAYIAGYTSGGSPFGTTWEEIGERPLLTKEEIEPVGFVD
jgi:hypothetical protein